MRALLAVALAALISNSGCSAVLYYGFPEKTTREVDRSARVVVRSYPRGAQIVGPGGEVLGAAPLATEVPYKVRSTATRSSTLRAAIGCAIDLAALAGTIYWSTESPDSTTADVAFYGSLGLFAGCFSLALVKGINAAFMSKVYDTMQAPQILESPLRRSDEVIAGEVEVEARWVDGGSARATLRGPGQTEVALRQPPARTFDEALMRYDEKRGRGLGAEGLFRRGAAYHARAVAGGGAQVAARARADLERVLADPATPPGRAAKVKAMLEELK